MLSTIAGSTITVAGVVFSITLAAVTYASGQFGPRLLGNFMEDQGNQTTLGIFIGTYLYCLVVLRTIRSAQEASADLNGAVREAFVPHIAMFGGLALAIVSTAVLIYFVHHVTSGIHINNVIARVGRNLIDDIRKIESDSNTQLPDSAQLAHDSVAIPASTTGYIEVIDFDALCTIACRHDMLVRTLRRAGDFVAQGWPLLEVHSDCAISPALMEECVAAISVGRQRTSQQDIRFAIDELVEIASRALSPGVNDPFTAIACIDWLSAALTEFDRCPAPSEVLSDRAGTARVLLQPLDFADFLEAAFGQLRSYVAADPNARRHAVLVLTELAFQVVQPRHRDMIAAERARLSTFDPTHHD